MFKKIFVLIITSLLLVASWAFFNTPSTEKSVFVESNTKIATSFNQLLQQHKGDVIYIDFWASWCGPCRKSFPWLNQIQQKYAKQKFTIISINVDNVKSNAEAFLAEHPVQYSVLFDSDNTLMQYFSVNAMPSSLLIDKQGQLVDIHQGFSEKNIAQYEQKIQALF
jgi:thiol-disulfide isomerase/thioredoxin